MPKCALHARRDTGLAHAQLLELAEAIHSCCLPALPGAILQRHTPSLASVSASGPPVPFQRLCFFLMTSGVMRGRQDGGLAPYLDYVRSSPQYESRFVESNLEWRLDVPDGLEVSTYLGP